MAFNVRINKKILYFLIVLAVFGFFAANNAFAITLENPLKDIGDDPRYLIGRIIKGILGLSGSMALLIFVYGGTIYLTAQGENEKIQRAKNTIVWATVGLVVIFGSYAFLTYLFKGLIGQV